MLTPVCKCVNILLGVPTTMSGFSSKAVLK